MTDKENTLELMLKNTKSNVDVMTQEEEGEEEGEEDIEDEDDGEDIVDGDENKLLDDAIEDDGQDENDDDEYDMQLGVEDDIVLDGEEHDDDEDEDDEDDDEDDYEDEDENEQDEYSYFTNNIRNKYIEAYHPESKNINPNQLKAMCTLVRDKDGNVIDDMHTTLPFLTKFEKTRVLGIRVNQLDYGGEPFIKIPETIIESRIIAEMELNQKMLPYIIARPLPNGRQEFWNLNDLDLLDV